MTHNLVDGLHHVTAIAGSTRNNVRFYTEILGLRFVKKTINYDSPDTWHLYYGDTHGSPGSAITFFPFKGVPRGRAGNGAMSATLFSIDNSALDFWLQRLKTYQVNYRGPHSRFNEQFITFDDFDGMHIELVATNSDQRSGWETPGIPVNYAIKGFYSAALSYASWEPTLVFLMKHLEHHILEKNDDRIRLYSGKAQPGSYVDLLSRPSDPALLQGTGTVHHLAFKTRDEDSQLEIREKLVKQGYHASPVMDRQYFRSIYFREPGGVLFEIATDGPGFTTDEDIKNLGSKLMLPHWLESQRNEIQENLDPLE